MNEIKQILVNLNKCFVLIISYIGLVGGLKVVFQDSIWFHLGGVYLGLVTMVYLFKIAGYKL